MKRIEKFGSQETRNFYFKAIDICSSVFPGFLASKFIPKIP